MREKNMRLSKQFKKDYKKIQHKFVMRVSRYKAHTKSGYQVKMEYLVDTEKNAKILGNLREINSSFDKMLTKCINHYADYVLEDKSKDWIGERSTRLVLAMK